MICNVIIGGFGFLFIINFATKVQMQVKTRGNDIMKKGGKQRNKRRKNMFSL